MIVGDSTNPLHITAHGKNVLPLSQTERGYQQMVPTLFNKQTTALKTRATSCKQYNHENKTKLTT